VSRQTLYNRQHTMAWRSYQARGTSVVVDDDHRLLVDDDLRSVLDGWDLLLRLLCLVLVRHRPGALLIVVRRLLARPLEDDRGRTAAKLALLAGPAVGTGLTNARTS
jgi:hypothetical protein